MCLLLNVNKPKNMIQVYTGNEKLFQDLNDHNMISIDWLEPRLHLQSPCVLQMSNVLFGL